MVCVLGSTRTSSNTIFYCNREFKSNVEGRYPAKHTLERIVSELMGESHVPYGAKFLDMLGWKLSAVVKESVERVTMLRDSYL